MATAIDTAHDVRPFLDCLKAAGYTAIFRYLCDPASTHIAGKSLTLAEAQAIAAAGFQIGSVFEMGNPTSATYFSRLRGYADGQTAVTFARAVNQPEHSAIYFTVDYDAGRADLPFIREYFAGVDAANMQADDPYWIGMYASGFVCQTAVLNGWLGPSLFWLPNAGGWAGMKDFNGWVVHQHVWPQICGMDMSCTDYDEMQGDPRLWTPMAAVA
jgi:hypothetical protein